MKLGVGFIQPEFVDGNILWGEESGGHVIFVKNVVAKSGS